MALQIRRGVEADRTSIVPAQGELLFTTDDRKLYVGDGTTVGGNIVTLTQGEVRTTVSNQFIHSGHKGITFTYDSLTGRISASPDGIYIAGDDSVGRLVNLGEAIKFAGTGTSSVTTDAEGNVTVNSLVYNLSAETTTGGANIRLSTLAGFDDVKLSAGSGINITRTDADTITITNTGSGGGGGPSGNDTEIQFNDSGLFAGDTALTWNKTTNVLTTPTVNVDAIVSNSASFSIFNTADPFITLGGILSGTPYSGKLRNIDTGPHNPSLPSSAVFYNVHNGDQTNLVTFNRSRGSITAKSQVQAFDTLGGMLWTGFDGTADGQAALIACLTTTTPASGSGAIPGLLVVQTADAAGTLRNAVWVDQNQTTTFYGNVSAQKDITNGTITVSNNVISTVVSNADLELRSSGSGAIYLDNISINNNTIASSTTVDLNAATRTRITSGLFRLNRLTQSERDLFTAENGDLIYNTDAHKFQGYENGSWVNLI